LDRLKSTLTFTGPPSLSSTTAKGPVIRLLVLDVTKLLFSKGIVVESYGGQTPIFRQTGGPLDPVLEKIRARLEATRGSPVSAGQVLSRFYRQQEIVIVM
jgi:hypothetical protein